MKNSSYFMLVYILTLSFKYLFSPVINDNLNLKTILFDEIKIASTFSWDIRKVNNNALFQNVKCIF